MLFAFIWRRLNLFHFVFCFFCAIFLCKMPQWDSTRNYFVYIYKIYTICLMNDLIFNFFLSLPFVFVFRFAFLLFVFDFIFLFEFCNFVRRAKVIWTFVWFCLSTRPHLRHVTACVWVCVEYVCVVCMYVCVPWLLPLFTLTLELYFCFVAASDSAKWKL